MSDTNNNSFPDKPDLDETTNVTDAHTGLNSPAAREKRLKEEGLEPLSLWVIIGSAIVLLIAGGVIGAGGHMFDYQKSAPVKYVRAVQPGGGAVAKPVEAMEAFMRKGEQVYSTKCATCHGPSGAGSSAYPPLAGSEWVTGHTQTLALIPLNGLNGPIEVAGKQFNSQMTAMGQGLSPAELAALLTYVRNAWGNDSGDIISVDMAKEAIALSNTIGAKSFTAAELQADHAVALPGEALDPTALVNKRTLVPEKAAE